MSLRLRTSQLLPPSFKSHAIPGLNQWIGLRVTLSSMALWHPSGMSGGFQVCCLLAMCMAVMSQSSSLYSTAPPPGCVDISVKQCVIGHTPECKAGWDYDNHMHCCPCLAGQHKAYCGKSSKCIDCPSGHFSGAASANCSACLPGTFGPTNGLSKCTDCLVGTYSSDESQSECTQCEPGTFNSFKGGNSSSVCKPCSSGSYSGPGQGSCDYCPAGTYNPNPRGTSVAVCMSCKAGTFSGLGATICSECGPASSATMLSLMLALCVKLARSMRITTSHRAPTVYRAITALL
jgi:hypothetical protein